MRVKVPQTLVTFPREGEIIVYNYLTKTAIACAPSDIYWLTVAPDWTSIEEISASHPHIESKSLQEQIVRLVDLGILLGEDTPEAESESSYRQSWELGMAAGLFHFSVQDNEYAAPQAGVSKPFRIVGIPDEETVPGAQADIFRHYGISMEGLSEAAAKLLKS